MKFLESKKFIITVILLNCIVIFILIVNLFYMHSGEKKEAKVEPVEGIESPAPEQQLDTGQGLVELYISLLEGSRFNLADGIYFRFDTEGKYSGFFDSLHTGVSGYSYEISIEGDEILLHLYNKEKSQSMTYGMDFNEDGDVVLDHPDMEEKIVLSY